MEINVGSQILVDGMGGTTFLHGGVGRDRTGRDGKRPGIGREYSRDYDREMHAVEKGREHNRERGPGATAQKREM